MTEYYPHPKLKPVKSYNVNVRGRIGLERRICRRTIKELSAVGYALRVHSGDDWETPCGASEETLMRALFNLDDAWLFAFKRNRQYGWVRFVFGNDGWDVISDYTLSLEVPLRVVEAYVEKIEG